MGVPTSHKVREKWGTICCNFRKSYQRKDLRPGKERKINVKSGGRGRPPYMVRWINVFNMAYKVF
jgi:hypothetical protein